MSDDLVNQLWESDEASALTNRAARRIEELEAREEAIVRAALESAAERAQRRWALRREHADRLYEMDYPEAKIDAKTVGAKADEAEGIAEEILALASNPANVAAILKKAGGGSGMSDAPERIWADGQDYWANPTFKDDKTEYVRADLIEELETKLSKSEALLKKAVKMAYEPCPFGYGTEGYYDWWYNRHNLLAELKGEK